MSGEMVNLFSLFISYLPCSELMPLMLLFFYVSRLMIMLMICDLKVGRVKRKK